MDVRTGKFEFSPEFSLMLGFDPSEYLMDLDTFSALLHPDDKKMTLDTLDRYLHGKYSNILQSFVLRQDQVPGSGSYPRVRSLSTI